MSQPVERESMEVDVLFIGAGPATLASALHLVQGVEAHNARAEKAGGTPIEPPTILVLEKGAEVGDHMLSGAVMNPKAIAELIPDHLDKGFPLEHRCTPPCSSPRTACSPSPSRRPTSGRRATT